jgi:hypothetical protein
VELILFLQIGVTETNTNALGRIQNMMAYWEVVVSLDRQDMLGSWHQRIVAMCLSQTGHLNAISHHALTRFEFACMYPSFFIL